MLVSILLTRSDVKWSDVGKYIVRVTTYPKLSEANKAFIIQVIPNNPTSLECQQMLYLKQTSVIIDVTRLSKVIQSDHIIFEVTACYVVIEVTWNHAKKISDLCWPQYSFKAFWKFGIIQNYLHWTKYSGRSV